MLIVTAEGELLAARERDQRRVDGGDRVAAEGAGGGVGIEIVDRPREEGETVLHRLEVGGAPACAGGA